jgi:uncharacterized membrane protein
MRNVLCGSRLLGILVLTVLAACSEPVDTPPTASPLETAPQAQPDAGSSSAASDGGQADRRRVFAFDCQGQYVVAEFSEQQAWLFLPGATVKLPRKVSASGAHYGDESVSFWSKGEEATLEQHGARVNCRVDRRNTPFEAAKLDGADFRALGNEPGWELVMYYDRIRFTWDYGNEQAEFPATQPVTDQERASSAWTSSAGDMDIEILLQALPCLDTMSGDSFETTVTVKLDGREFHGCGRALH